MLKFTNVNFSYDKHPLILHKFNLQFVDQKINCIIGPSAVGKSTLLNLIARTIKPQSGEINNSYRNISYLFQEERLINEITVFKNLDLILKSVYDNPEKRRKIIMSGLKSVKLAGTSD
jgi:NitT/TauT family transport system ATP-binding protein